MKHRIETNIPITATREVAKCLDVVRRRVGDIEFIDGVSTDDNFADNLVLIVKGNGAFLREVAYGLDVFGALD